MAGIGFILRKLMKKEDLSSLFRAYFHSMMASSGQWIITVLSLGSFYLFSKNLVSDEAYLEFRLIILYNFAFSLVVASPITNCSTRYLADLIYSKRLDLASGLMIGMLILLFIVSLIPVSAYYFFYTKMTRAEVLQSILNFVLIASIWHAGIFISALKYYTGITFTFLFGMTISILSAVKLSEGYGLVGMLAGFNLGLGFILASLIALVFVEYPPEVKDVFKILNYFKKYWEIALGYFLYTIALWIDKWIMWFSPERVKLPNNMVMFPEYDSAMFISYLTIIPVMAMFLLSQETVFFESYLRYYQGIQNHDPLSKIKAHHSELMRTIVYLSRNLVFLQAFVALVAILFAPKIFEILGINLIQIGMFRYGVLGASFQIMSLLTMITLTYFDYRRGALYIALVYLFTNTTFTLITLKLGIAYYGYGFFLASLVSFLFGGILMENYLRNLPFHTFVSQNVERFVRRSLDAQSEKIQET